MPVKASGKHVYSMKACVMNKVKADFGCNLNVGYHDMQTWNKFDYFAKPMISNWQRTESYFAVACCSEGVYSKLRMISDKILISAITNIQLWYYWPICQANDVQNKG